ncbi:MAG: hypothetical protein V4549_03500 [Bacteroidota bacterium]
MTTTRASTGNMLKDLQGLAIINEDWASQATWYIDPIIGNDENTGIDLPHAIKTWGELRRRMKAVGGHSTAGTYIYVLSDPSDAMVLDWGCHSNIDVHILGSTTVARTGQMTSGLITRDAATNQANELTDLGVSSWTSEICFNSGKILRMSSGDALGQHAWVLKDLGSHKARLSAFWDISNGEEIFSDDGENYEMLSMPFVQNYYLVPTSGFFFLKYFNLGNENSTQYQIAPATATQGCQLTYCAIYNIDTSNNTIYLANCCLKTSLRLFTGTVEMFAGCMGSMDNNPFAFSDGEIETAGELYCDAGVCFQGVRENIINCGYLRSVDLMIFDSPDNGITVGTGGIIRITKLSGSGNIQHGLYISPSGTVFANLANCTIDGNVEDIYFAGTDYSWATLQGLGYLKSATSYASISPV